MMNTIDVLAEIRVERARQDEKFGEQNHPDGTGPNALQYLAKLGCSSVEARYTCDRLFESGLGTFAAILFEEVAEAIEEKDQDRLREELKQVSAVAVLWIETIDRRRSTK